MGFGNSSVERAAIEQTYEDIATVSRTKQITGANKVTTSVPVDVYSNTICALSMSGSDGEQTKAQNRIEYDAVVFFPPELSILAGDKITLKRFGRENPNSSIVYNFKVVGRPAIYATHQEVKVKDGDLS